MTLQNRFCTMVAEQGLTQKELATVLEVSESYIFNILHGKRSVLPEPLAVMIEEYYGYSAAWLLTGEEPKYASEEACALSLVRGRIIEAVKAMDEPELNAVLEFMREHASTAENLAEASEEAPEEAETDS